MPLGNDQQQQQQGARVDCTDADPVLPRRPVRALSSTAGRVVHLRVWPFAVGAQSCEPAREISANPDVRLVEAYHAGAFSTPGALPMMSDMRRERTMAMSSDKVCDAFGLDELGSAAGPLLVLRWCALVSCTATAMTMARMITTKRAIPTRRKARERRDGPESIFTPMARGGAKRGIDMSMNAARISFPRGPEFTWLRIKLRRLTSAGDLTVI
jgi:hypothetical protein